MREGTGPVGAARSCRPRQLAAGILAVLGSAGLLWLGLDALRGVRDARSAWPATTGAVSLPGLEARAVVLRDARGIPHVQAASEADALRALGYVHAQDRPGQMLWLRRVARGRAAEVVGRPGLEADRLARLLGIGELADRAARELSGGPARLLAAYAQGVNARLERVRAGAIAPPAALAGLGPTAEPAWRAGDSLAVLKLYAWALGGALDASLVLDDLVRVLGGLEARPFFPEGSGIDAMPYGARARAPGGAGPGDALGRLAGLSGAGLGSAAWVVAGRYTESGRPLLAADLHVEARVPSLLYEAHLSARPAPDSSASSPGASAGPSRPGVFDVAGATIPGLPLFWVGRNRRVAWAAVHARALTTDLYVETLHPRDREAWVEEVRAARAAARRAGDGALGELLGEESAGAFGPAEPGEARTIRYHDGHTWRPLALRREVIAVRGEQDVVLPVRSSAHGPLVNPVVAHPPAPDGDAPSAGDLDDGVSRGESGAWGEDLEPGLELDPEREPAPGRGLAREARGPRRSPVALAWTGARTGSGVAGLLALARARDAGDVRRALAAHREPAVAVVYADDRGEAGVKVAGWLPRRELPTGLLPVPARAPGYAWHSPVPAERLPEVILAGGEAGQGAEQGEGAKGWAVAADNRLPGAEGLGTEWLWQTGERAARLEVLLAAAARRGSLDARDLAAMQRDVHSGRSREIVARALGLLGRGEEPGPEAAEVARWLKAWDGRSGAESRGAAVYHVFLEELLRRLLGERLGSRLAERYLALDLSNPVELVAEILAAGAGAGEGLPGWDDPERLAAAVRESLRATWLRLAVEIGANRKKWVWGRLHPLRFRPLIPGGGRALGPFALGGDGLTVAAAAYDHAAPFAVEVVAGYRFVADLGEPAYLLSSLAPGPSEHPGHPHRSSGLERWLTGRPEVLATSPLLVEETALERLVLEPAR